MPMNQNIQATLNRDLAYKLVPKPDLNTAGIVLPYNWLSQFDRELGCAGRLDSRHVTHAYGQVNALRESLKIIYIFYHGLNGHPINENEQNAIKDKILEGVENCTPGFHNRVNQIITGFVVPDSIDALLMAYRTEIVASAAIKHTDEVHGHNQYFTQAKAQGYGIHPVNEADPYRNFLSVHEVNQKIQAAFENKYHPLAILDNLVEGYKSVLISQHDYTGFKTTGYTTGDYEEWCVYLAKLLEENAETINLNKFLIFDEEMINIVDINWTFVKSELAMQLLFKQYLNLDNAAEQVFVQLTEESESLEDFDMQASMTLIPDEATFINVLEKISSKQADFGLRYLAFYLNGQQLNAAEKDTFYLKLIQRPSLGLLTNILISTHPHVIQNELWRIDNNAYGLARALMTKQKKLFQAYLNILPNLQAHQIETLFRYQTNNPLIVAAKTAPWAIDDLLVALSSFPITMSNALRERAASGDNLLMLACSNGWPEGIESLLNAYLALGDDELASALEYNGNGAQNRNLLFIAADKNKSSFDLIWRSFNNVLSPQSVDRNLLNAIKYALEHNKKQAVKPLLKTLYTLDENRAKCILQQIGNDLLKSRSEATHLIQTTKILSVLLQKSQDLKTTHPDASLQAKLLHDRLQSNFEIYLNAEDNAMSRNEFCNAWKQEIDAAKHSTLVQHRGYKELFALALCVISGIGLLLLGAKAIQHYAKEGHLHFFHLTKTNVEQCMDSLEQEAQSEVAVHNA